MTVWEGMEVRETRGARAGIQQLNHERTKEKERKSRPSVWVSILRHATGGREQIVPRTGSEAQHDGLSFAAAEKL